MAPEAIIVYRKLLRAINRNITSITGNKQWILYAKEEFRSHRAEDDQESAADDRARRLQLAKDYAFLIDGVREHKELLLSYNVGIPTDDREKNMKERAAALVGLALPVVGR